MDTVAQLVANGFIAGSGYGLLGLSLALIYATSHFFHFAHGAVYSVAAYVAFALCVTLGVTPWIALPCAVVVAAAYGAAVDLCVYAPLRWRRASPLALLLSSLGVFVATEGVVSLVFGAGLRILPGGAIGGSIALFGARVTILQVVAFAVATCLYLLTVWALRATESGRMIRAVASDADLARAFGVDVARVVTVAFIAGSALAAVAAVLAAYDTGLKPTMGFNALLVAVVAVIVGGLGNPTAAFWGGMTLGFAQQIGAWVLPSRWQDVIVYLILVGVLLVRPHGFAGPAAREAKV